MMKKRTGESRITHALPVSVATSLLGTMMMLTIPLMPAAEPLRISVEDSAAKPLSDDVAGLSYETSVLLPGADGRRYFRADNAPLVQMFKTLGVKNLRIGGNSVDDPSIPIPTEDDIRSLFEFARAAGVKVIYSVRLQDGDPESAAKVTKLIRENYADLMDCFSIGNEPDYYHDYNVLKAKWTAIQKAMLAEWPEARFCGMDQNPKPALIKKVVEDFGKTGNFVMITQHSYPFGCSYSNPQDAKSGVDKLIPQEPVSSRQRMLSADAYKTYAEILEGMVEAVAGTGLSFRLTETNSYWFSGLKGVSDRYVSAIWGLDYLHWWATHGSDGINFHTGDRTGGGISLPCRYAVFVSSEEGYAARPLAYAMKMFALGEFRSPLQIKIPSSDSSDVVAYGGMAGKNELLVTLINKAHGGTAKDRQVVLSLPSSWNVQSAETVEMRSATGDPGADSGISVGKGEIGADGSWDGKWTPVATSSIRDSGIDLSIAPLSAVVVRISLK